MSNVIFVMKLIAFFQLPNFNILIIIIVLMMITLSSELQAQLYICLIQISVTPWRKLDLYVIEVSTLFPNHFLNLALEFLADHDVLQARLQQYVNRELSDVQDGFTKGRGTTDQIANIHWILEKTREFQKNICFIDYTKAFDCVGHKLWEILKEMRIPDYLNCLLRNPYSGQEATVRT